MHQVRLVASLYRKRDLVLDGVFQEWMTGAKFELGRGSAIPDAPQPKTREPECE